MIFVKRGVLAFKFCGIVFDCFREDGILPYGCASVLANKKSPAGLFLLWFCVGVSAVTQIGKAEQISCIDVGWAVDLESDFLEGVLTVFVIIEEIE